MDLNKIKEVQFYIEKIASIEKLNYKIVIVKNAYFFFIDENYIKDFYSDEHKDIKGWYAGVLSFTLSDPNLLYIFISEILYNNVDAKNLFLRILHQILIYLNPSFSKLKIKKFRKQLKNYLSSVFLNENVFTNEFIESFLNDRKDLELFKEAEILIPHITLYNLIERFSFSNKIAFLENVKLYLKPFEYINLHVKHYDEHNH
ncbi:hypothetical protein KEJ50_06385 [Candidatus Bathyarchaeota archaeon]|nr:hypothetical protein [Candidatus Bathyarchaeota archaeon]